MSRTIEDAHRDADSALVCALWYKELLTKYGLDTTPGDVLITERQQRITDLTAQEAPPADLQTSTDAYIQPMHDGVVDSKDRLNTIVNDPATAELLWPGSTDYPTDNQASLDQVTDYLDALLLVWTPPA